MLCLSELSGSKDLKWRGDIYSGGGDSRADEGADFSREPFV